MGDFDYVGWNGSDEPYLTSYFDRLKHSNTDSRPPVLDPPSPKPDSA
jgi:hypothetical protein